MGKLLEIIIAATLSLSVGVSANAKPKYSDEIYGDIILDIDPSKRFVDADKSKTIVYEKNKNIKLFEEYCTSSDCESSRFVAYYKNGQMKSKGQFLDGKEEGVWFDWYDNGQLRWVNNYYKGKRHGTQMMWEKDGKLSVEQNFIDGKLFGKYVEWTKDGGGTIVNYANGKKHGDRIWFNKFGKITHRYTYVHGIEEQWLNYKNNIKQKK